MTLHVRSVRAFAIGFAVGSAIVWMRTRAALIERDVAQASLHHLLGQQSRIVDVGTAVADHCAAIANREADPTPLEFSPCPRAQRPCPLLAHFAIAP